MRVFVTGATGFIGSAVVQDLIAAGHEVVGLARSDAAADLLTGAGAEVHRGALDNLDSLKRGAAASDGVIHTGFIHDFSKFNYICEVDRQAIQALGSALAGSDRPLIITSGTLLLARGHLAVEDDVPTCGSNPRIASEEAARTLAKQGVNVSIVRLPPTVHGDGDHAFIPLLINIAREKGISAYVGDGQNRWPAVHRLDTAPLFRLAFEKGIAGATFHGVAEEGVPFREIANVIGRRLDIPVVSQTPEEATKHFHWFEHFAAADNPTSSKKTREILGWDPKQTELIADIDRESYFTKVS